MELIDGASTLVLATCDTTGPWSAPVYYVFADGMFYFFSSPESRHIRQASASETAAASIFHQADAWQTIRGLQMQGSIAGVDQLATAAAIIAAYLKRFPFTRSFFPTNVKPDLHAFFSRFKARLYRFAPQSVFYTDNRFGFATRERIPWNH